MIKEAHFQLQMVKKTSWERANFGQGLFGAWVGFSFGKNDWRGGGMAKNPESQKQQNAVMPIFL